MKLPLFATAALLASEPAAAGEPNLDLFGKQAFATEVKGFITTDNPTASEARDIDGETWAPGAFLTITEYFDDRFRSALLRVIGMGNTVNSLDPSGHLQFRLGCFDGKTISNESFLIPPKDQKALLEATPQKPVRVSLRFDPGVSISDSACISLADGLTVLASTDTTAL